MDSTKERTSGRNAVPGDPTSPLKPKNVLSGPPVREGKMSYGYRFCAWLVEMLSEAIVLPFIPVVMIHVSEPITPRDIAGLTIGTLTFFCVSGYALTTLVFRLALRGRWLRVYPVIAPLLFLAHFEIMNLLVPEGLMEPHNRFIFRVSGSGVVVVVATAISLVLERIEKRLLPSKADNA
jgi:hypothetical protein